VGAPVDYVLAVHVIEHVPDVIGWLLDLHGVLRQDGIVSLVVPDRRFTFDILQPVSTVGQMLDAYLEKRRRPSPGQKFDFTSLWRAVDVQSAWRGDIDVEALPPIGSNATALAFAQAKEIFSTRHYMDCHCWIFTPSSFLDAVGRLAEVELFPFSLTSFQTTLSGEFEFIVQLSARSSGEGPSIAASIDLAKRSLKSEIKLASTASGSQQLETEISKLRAEIGALKSSTSWKITAPLRSLSRLAKRVSWPR
jgi:hypothetical protein